MRSPRRPTGSTRVVVALAIAVTLGVAAYLVARAVPADPIRPRQPLSVVDPSSTPAELPDLGPVAAVRASGGSTAAFEKAALDHVLGVVASGTLPRRAGETLSLEQAAALDPKVAAGRLVETAGWVRSLDKESFESKANPQWDQLWSFELASDAAGGAGPHVVVISPGDSKMLDGGVPARAHMEGTTAEPVKNGDRVRVRGVWLQRRTGAIGAIPSLSAPAAVIVGREYRVTGDVKPPPASLKDVEWAKTEDSTNEQTRNPADEVHWQALAWARSRGPVAIANDLASGALPVLPWNSTQFLLWRKDVENDHGQQPDPRTWTLERRGRVFALTGHLADVVTEDWAQVDVNPYDVDRRHVWWVASDSYANASIPFFSAFGPEAFPKVPQRKPGVDAPRIRVFGVYARNFTYTLRGQEHQEITVPSFHLLYIERN